MGKLNYVVNSAYHPYWYGMAWVLIFGGYGVMVSGIVRLASKISDKTIQGYLETFWDAGGWIGCGSGHFSDSIGILGEPVCQCISIYALHL